MVDVLQLLQFHVGHTARVQPEYSAQSGLDHAAAPENAHGRIPNYNSKFHQISPKLG